MYRSGLRSVPDRWRAMRRGPQGCPPAGWRINAPLDGVLVLHELLHREEVLLGERERVHQRGRRRVPRRRRRRRRLPRRPASQRGLHRRVLRRHCWGCLGLKHLRSAAGQQGRRWVRTPGLGACLGSAVLDGSGCAAVGGEGAGGEGEGAVVGGVAGAGAGRGLGHAKTVKNEGCKCGSAVALCEVQMATTEWVDWMTTFGIVTGASRATSEDRWNEGPTGSLGGHGRPLAVASLPSWGWGNSTKPSTPPP